MPRNGEPVPIAWAWAAQAGSGRAQGERRGEGSWVKPDSISAGGNSQRMAEIIHATGLEKSPMGPVGFGAVGSIGEGQGELPPRPSTRAYGWDGRGYRERPTRIQRAAQPYPPRLTPRTGCTSPQAFFCLTLPASLKGGCVQYPEWPKYPVSVYASVRINDGV